MMTITEMAECVLDASARMHVQKRIFDSLKLPLWVNKKINRKTRHTLYTLLEEIAAILEDIGETQAVLAVRFPELTNKSAQLDFVNHQFFDKLVSRYKFQADSIDSVLQRMAELIKTNSTN